jgi:hypothetical protein
VLSCGVQNLFAVSETVYISLRAGSQRPPLQGSPGFFSALIRRLFSLARSRLIEQNA